MSEEEEVGTAVIRVVVDRSGVQEEIDKSIADTEQRVKTKGSKLGNDYGDAYTKALGTKLNSAIGALPDRHTLKLDADTTDAERQLLAVRGELSLLSEKKIGIDIDEHDAMVKLGLLRTELDALSKDKRNSIQVRVDSTQARNALNELDNELRKFGNDAEKAAGGKGGGGGGVGALLTALITLGPALVPIGAVAAGAMGALALSAGSALLAVKGISNEMAHGTQQGVTYAAGLSTLKSDLSGLEHTAASSVLGPFQRTVDTLNKSMPFLNKEVQSFGAFGAQSGSNLVGGLIPVLKTMSPLFTQIEQDLLRGTQRFQEWAQAGGMRGFTQYALTELPKVEQTITELVRAIAKIVEALGPLGGFGLTVLKDVSEAINALPLPVLKALTEALAAAFIVMKGVAVVRVLTEAYNALGAAVARVVVAQDAQAASGLLGRGGGKAGGLGKVASKVGPELSGGLGVGATTEGATGFSAAIAAVGGPALAVGAMFIALGVGLGLLAHHFSDADKQSQAFRTELGSYGDVGKTLTSNTAAFADALKQSSGAIDTNVASLVQANLASSGLDKQAQKSGISIGQLTDGIQGSDAQYRDLINTWRASGKVSNDTLISYTALRNEFKKGQTDAAGYQKQLQAIIAANMQAALTGNVTTTSIQSIANLLHIGAGTATSYAEAVGVSNEQIANGTISNQDFANAANLSRDAMNSGSDAAAALVKQMEAFSQSDATAADRAALLGQYLVSLQGDALTFTGSMAAAYNANQQLIYAFDNETKAGKAKTTAYQNTERAAIDFTKAQHGLLTATIDYTKQGAGPLVQQLEAMQTAAANAAEATFKHELATKGGAQAALDAAAVFKGQTIDALEKDYKQLGLTKGQADALAKSYFDMPNLKTTTVKAIGMGDINTTLNQIGQQLAYISHHPWNLTVDANTAPAVAKINALIQHGSGVNATFTVRGGNVGVQAEGSMLQFFASGGENHIAQIAAAGSTRVWAEPETGGEAYIPLAPGKRGRSMEILNEVANKFGVQSYASGGIATATRSSSMSDMRIDRLIELLEQWTKRPVRLEAKGTELATLVNDANLTIARRAG